MEQGTVYSMRVGAKPPPSDAVRIDRQTVWGNPIRLRLESDREDVIAAYKRWLWKKMKEDENGFFIKVAALAGRPLKCWCAPKACHGDVLSAAALYARGELLPCNEREEAI